MFDDRLMTAIKNYKRIHLRICKNFQLQLRLQLQLQIQFQLQLQIQIQLNFVTLKRSSICHYGRLYMALAMSTAVLLSTYKVRGSNPATCTILIVQY